MKIQHLMALVVLSLATVPGARAAVLAGPITNAANAHAYFLLSSNTWTASEAEAVGLGGHLVTINDAAENQWVLNTFFPLTGVFYASLWIGLNDAANEGQFVWASGEPVTFTYWYPGEPNNLGLGGEDYATIRHPSEAPPTGSWNDLANTPSAPTFGVVEVPTPLPVAVTQSADQFMPGSARLNGQANPNGSPTLAWFEWGTSLAYGNTTPPQSVGSGSNAVGFSNVLTGLVSNTDYHFRARASNAFGSLAGLDQTFNLSNQRPVVTTLAADQLTTNSARLRGQVNPRGSPTAAWFEWGTDTNYGNVIGPQDIGQGSSVSNLNVVLNGLTTGTNYHYRLVATNAFGAGYGANQTFKPAQRPPTTITWTGADPSGYWSAPANWSPAGVLVNGDDLVFPGGLLPGDKVSTNDLTDSFFRSITFNGAGGHTIRGNPTTLTNRAPVITCSGTNVIACDLVLSATVSPSTPYWQWPSIWSSYPSELTLSGNIVGSNLNSSASRLVISGEFPGGRIYTYGGTVAFYGDHLHALFATNQGGAFFVQGSQPNLNLTMLWEMESAACGSLSGAGSVGDIMGCGHFVLDSTLSVKSLVPVNGYWRVLDIKLNGTNVGEYGRLIASGDVTLTGGSLTPSPGFNPQLGQVFTIVEKTSPGAIANAPFGPEGTITTLNGMPCRISYVGGDGNDVTLTVEEPNTPPTVTITNPPGGVVFTAPASFALEASASDPDGSVTNVQFFRDAISLGNDTSSPYSVAVSGLVAGDYTLSAVASDNRGRRATNSIAISVNNSSNCVAVPSGLVAWWRAEGNANDATGSHDGQLLYGATFAPGRSGQAFSFSGVRSRVNIPDSDEFKLTNSLTFEGWIRAASWAPGIIFIRGDNRGGLDPYHMSLSSSGHLHWGIDAADNSTAVVDDPSTLPIGVWTHVAGVFNGANGDLDLYVNGSLVRHATTQLRPFRDLDPNSEPAVGIGNSGGTFHEFPYHGLIDEWSLYGRALSGQEILGIYQAGALGKCAINPRPSVTTLAPDPLNTTSARLRGQVNPRGWPATVWFEWGASLAYGNVTPPQSVEAGTNAVGFSNVMADLVSGTEYHFRAYASNEFGFATGIDQTFNLSNYRPVVTTLAADQPAATSARLRGQVNPRGAPTAAWFEWGTDTNYGNVIGRQDVGQGSSVSDLNVVLDGLMGGPTYHYRLVATNAFGAVYGADRAFGLGFVSIPIPGPPGVLAGSVAWGDYDNDGWLDFLLTGLTGSSPVSQVWRNTGNGFSNVTARVAPGLPGVYFSSVAWGDYDNDGRLDFLLTGLGISQLWRNTGTRFSNVTASVAPGLPGVRYSSVAWADYDNDGRLDFLLTGFGTSPVSQVWRNTGSGFSNVTASVAPGLPGVYQGSVAWGDYDNDGRLDFLLSGSGVSQVWRNTGSGFSNVTASVAPGLSGVLDGSVAWGDYDNDGQLDFLLATTWYGGSQLWRNTGSGFSNVTASVAPGLPPRTSVAWGDHDNDGRLDFLITGTSNAVPPQLWRNTVGGFSNVTAGVAPGLPGSFSGSVAWGDFDNDGRLDFLHTAAGQLWRNNMPVSNAPPAAPTGLSSTLSGATVSLSWNPPADDRTPSAGLNYNLRIGTTPGASDVLAPMASTDGLRLLPALGNAQTGTNAFAFNLAPGRDYYWSVQAVDTSFAGSPFAAEQQFTVAATRIIELVMLGNGHFQFSFSNEASVIYAVLGTTNVALPLAQWTVLGPPVSLGGGLYRFTDLLATNHAQRFYLLRAQ